VVVTANDRLFDELLRPIADDYYETAKALHNASEATLSSRWALMARMSCLQECGDRTARVLEVAEPLWDDMRGLVGLSW
jgi:hypothetical protein